MKKYLFVTIIAFLFVTCGKQTSKRERFGSSSISVKIDKQIKGEVLLDKDKVHNFYDISITDDYYAFLSYYSDTLIFSFNKKDLSSYLFSLRDVKRPTYEFPSFVKYNCNNKGRKNVIDVLDNDILQIKHCCLEDALSSPLMTITTSALPAGYIPSNSCSITKDEYYLVAYFPTKSGNFYSLNETTSYYQVKPYPVIPGFRSQDTNKALYTSSICVNEDKGVIVAGLRFINGINFYDLNCDPTKAFIFGDHHLFPTIGINDNTPIQGNVKHFIDVASTDKFVYCLYDGTVDYSAPSTIVIFNWDGKHIRNLQTDIPLCKIAVENNDKTLIGIAINKNGERVVMKYNL